MKQNISNFESHSRSEHEKSLSQYMKETIGDYNHSKGYTFDVISNFIYSTDEFSKFIKCDTEIEEIMVDNLFDRISESIDFNVYLQRKVCELFKDKFTSQQLSCIFQSINGVLIDYHGKSDINIKQNLLDYVATEGRHFYNIGDVEAFRKQISEISPIEFDVFINLIYEAWQSMDDMISKLLQYLKKD